MFCKVIKSGDFWQIKGYKHDIYINELPFNELELRTDFLMGNLPIEEEDFEEFKYSSLSFEKLQEYVNFKNTQIQKLKETALFQKIDDLERKMDVMSDYLLKFIEELNLFKKVSQKPKYKYLEEVYQEFAEIGNFKFSLSRFRDIISTNRSFDEKTNEWRSYIKIESFIIHFFRADTQKRWLLHSVELDREEAKLNQYDFRRKIVK